MDDESGEVPADKQGAYRPCGMAPPMTGTHLLQRCHLGGQLGGGGQQLGLQILDAFVQLARLDGLREDRKRCEGV